MAVILVFAGITWARFDLADRRQEMQRLNDRKSMLLPGYLRYGRDRYKLAHLQHWESADAKWLEHLRYICMVDDSRARGDMGYAPRSSMEETLRAVFSER